MGWSERRVLAVAVQGGHSLVERGQPLGGEPPRRGRSRGRSVVKLRRAAGVCVQRRRARCGDRCRFWTLLGEGA